MRTVLTAAAASVSALVFATGALAQTASPQVTTPAGANAAPAAQQQQVTIPSVITTIRRAGMGAGGFTQLCDDPLDPRAFTDECSAAGIGQ